MAVAPSWAAPAPGRPRTPRPNRASGWGRAPPVRASCSANADRPLPIPPGCGTCHPELPLAGEGSCGGPPGWLCRGQSRASLGLTETLVSGIDRTTSTNAHQAIHLQRSLLDVVFGGAIVVGGGSHRSGVLDADQDDRLDPVRCEPAPFLIEAKS